MDTNAYDVVIVGAGSGGVSVASMLVDAGRRVALVASGFVGGACPYVACMPSKSLVRSARARTEARELVEHGAAGHAVDVGAEGPAWVQAVRRRDETANNRDDTKHAEGLREQGIDVVRGFGVLVGGGNVEVDGRVLHGEHIVIDTGSVPVRPDIDGLEAVPWWTSDQALTNDELPERLLVLGGGPIGCELAQAYAAFGTAVTIVDTATRLVPSEDDVISEAMMTVLQVAGVRLVLGATPGQVEPDGEGVRMKMNNGTTLHADRLLVVVGRKPATEGLDAEAAGATLADDGSIATDEYCRAAPGLWAIGDVTGLAPYTHTANHQARVVGDAILGRKGHPVTADVLPRAVFTEPPLGAAGLTETQARDRDIDVVVVDVDLADVSRAGAEGQGPLGPPNSSGGVLRLIINRESRLLLGAAAVGPHADAWIGEATLAIRARVPVDVLADVVRPFPTYPEAFTLGYQRALDQLS